MLPIKVINKSRHPLPSYATAGAARLDLRASLSEPITLQPLERRLIPTGLYMELPLGYEAQIRPRSGLSIRYGITVINSPGTIDADYRGELQVPLVNLSNEPFVTESALRRWSSPDTKLLNGSSSKGYLRPSEEREALAIRGEGRVLLAPHYCPPRANVL